MAKVTLRRGEDINKARAGTGLASIGRSVVSQQDEDNKMFVLAGTTGSLGICRVLWLRSKPQCCKAGAAAREEASADAPVAVTPLC